MRKLAAAFVLLIPHWSLECAASGLEHSSEAVPQSAVEISPDLPGQVIETEALVERLFRLQDQGAEGEAGSLPAQKQLLVEIGGYFSNGPTVSPEALAFHVAAYVLSGGDPGVAERFSHIDEMPQSKRAVLRAAAAFMRGERENALQLLAAIDIAALPSFLGGRMALARAMMQEPGSAVQQDDLAFAMSRMPGTLVEESALRRSILAYGETGDIDAFLSRLDRYCRRFPQSIYGGGFWSEVTSRIVSWNMADPSKTLRKIFAALGRLPAGRQAEIYSGLLRTAAFRNQQKMVEDVASQLGAVAAPDSSAADVSRLYGNVYRLGSGESDAALKIIQSVRKDQLDPKDLLFLDAALTIGNRLSQPVGGRDGGASDTEPLQAPVIDRAENMLRESESVLGEMRS